MDSPITRRSLLLASAATGLLSTHARAGADSLRLIGADIPPLASRDDSVYLDPVMQIARRVGYEGSPTWLPLTRAIVESRSLGRSLLFPLARRPSNEKQWNWLAPLGTEEAVLVVRRDALKNVRDLQDPETIAKLAVGVLRECTIVAGLQQGGFTRLEYAPDARSQARKLALGRIQAWMTTRRTAEHWLAREQVQPELLWPLIPRGEATFYLAASLDVMPTELEFWRSASRHMPPIHRT
jgi:polar amino acid transport system substrate-binding protein